MYFGTETLNESANDKEISNLRRNNHGTFNFGIIS